MQIQTATTYSVSHSMGRASGSSADADAIVRRVNAATSGNGDSLFRDRVQAELDTVASAEIQSLYGITVQSESYEIEE